MIVIIFWRAAQFILLLLVMRLATTYLPPDEVGRLSLIAAAVTFYALFLVNPVGMFIKHRFHVWVQLGRVKHYIKLHWIYLLTVSMFAAASLSVLNSAHAFGFRFNTVWLLALVCGSLLFNTINQTAIPSLNMLEFRGRFVTLTLGTIGTSLVYSFLQVKAFDPAAEYWLLSFLIGQTVFAVIGGKWFFEKLRPEISVVMPTRAHLWRLFYFAMPIAILVGLNWLQTQGYQFFVADSLGLIALGLFVSDYSISSDILIVVSGLVFLRMFN
jgi:hypothetical protein